MDQVYTAVPLFNANADSSPPISSSSGEGFSFRNIQIKPILKYIVISILLLSPIPFIIIAVQKNHHVKPQFLNSIGMGMGGNVHVDRSTENSATVEEGAVRKLNGLRGASDGYIVHRLIITEQPMVHGFGPDATVSSSVTTTTITDLSTRMETEMMTMMQEAENFMAALMKAMLAEMEGPSLSGFEKLERAVPCPGNVPEIVGEQEEVQDQAGKEVKEVHEIPSEISLEWKDLWEEDQVLMENTLNSGEIPELVEEIEEHHEKPPEIEVEWKDEWEKDHVLMGDTLNSRDIQELLKNDDHKPSVEMV